MGVGGSRRGAHGDHRGDCLYLPREGGPGKLTRKDSQGRKRSESNQKNRSGRSERPLRAGDARRRKEGSCSAPRPGGKRVPRKISRKEALNLHAKISATRGATHRPRSKNFRGENPNNREQRGEGKSDLLPPNHRGRGQEEIWDEKLERSRSTKIEIRKRPLGRKEGKDL